MALKPERRASSRKPATARGGKGQAKPAGRAAGGPGPGRRTGQAASRLIDRRIRELGGWRGETLARMRALLLEAAPGIVEEWMWMGTPVWSQHGILCTGEAYKTVVKLTFARGASIPDPSRLFNSSLAGNTRRAIDIHEGESVDPDAFQALVRAAVTQNGAARRQ